MAWKTIQKRPEQIKVMEINRHNLMKLAYLGDKGMTYTHSYSPVHGEQAVIKLEDGNRLEGEFGDYLAKTQTGDWFIITKKEYSKEYYEV